MFTYKSLVENGFNPEYEPIKYKLLDGLKYSYGTLYTPGKDKCLKQASRAQLPTTYTPDFILHLNELLVIIESKGMATESFNIKKKMFLIQMENNKKPYMYFEPHSQKQVLEMIEILIKS